MSIVTVILNFSNNFMISEWKDSTNVKVEKLAQGCVTAYSKCRSDDHYLFRSLFALYLGLALFTWLYTSGFTVLAKAFQPRRYGMIYCKEKQQKYYQNMNQLA